MSIYGYNDSSKAIKKLLEVLDQGTDDQGVLLLRKQDHKTRFNGPVEGDKGQILDFEGFNHVWEVVEVEVLRTFGVNSDGSPDTYGTVDGYRLSVRVVEDPFPDELTEHATSRALAATTSAARAAQDQSTLGLARVGTYGIRSDGAYSQIEQVYWARVPDAKRTDQDERGNPRRRKIGKTVLMVQYRYEAQVTAARVLDKENTWTLKEHQKTYALLEGTMEDHLTISRHLLDGGELPQELADEIRRDQEQDAQAATALVASSNPEFLHSVALKAQRNANTAQVLRFAMQRNMTELHNRLAGMMGGLEEAVERFRKQMEKVQRLIVTLEIYLGVHEDLIQIAQGEKADPNEPISLRQLVLYADEEFGDPTNGGITFKDLPAFDAWLVDSEGYKVLAPEQRCVVAIKPRRSARRNAQGEVMPPQKDAKGKELDSYTYILIRNGDNLYRIQTPNISLEQTLFPRRAELQELITRMSQLQDLEMGVLEGKGSEYQLEKLQGQVEQELHDYRKSILLLQGLLFRTDVLHPIPAGLNLMKPDTYGDMLQFIYDAEAALPSGRMSFDEWQADANSRIQKGTRVLAAIYETSQREYIDSKNFRRRFTLANLSREGSIPPLPEQGVYQVETYNEPYDEPVMDAIPWAQTTEDEREEWRRAHSRWDSDLEERVLTAAEPATLERHRRGLKGRWEYTKSFRQHLVIRYKPTDTVYGAWGSMDGPHERKIALGFKIEPQRDEWLFNYDELTIADLNFYLTSRVDRVHYARIMPFLFRLRAQLQKELDWENSFARLLGERLGDELGAQLPASVDVVALALEAIQWYKLDKVKLKRSLTDDDAQALRMVEQRVRYYLRERFKLKAVDSATDYRKKTVIWHHEATGRSFVATGLLKKEFVLACFDFIQTALPGRYTYRRAEEVAVTRIEQQMQDTSLPAAVQLAGSKPGQVHELPS